MPRRCRTAGPVQWLVATVALVRVAAAADVKLRVALVTEYASQGHWQFYNGFRWGAKYVNDKFGGIPVGDGPPVPIEIVDYDTAGDISIGGQAAACVQQAARGVDAENNSVGDIHAVIAGTASTNGAIRTESQVQRIPNLHVSGGNPLDWVADNTFAFGMHLPFVEYTKGPMKLAELLGMKSIGIIRSQQHGFPRVSTVAALKWAQLASLVVVGPSKKWCDSHMNTTVTCRVVEGSCRCGEQDIADDLGIGITLTDNPTFYEVVEPNLGTWPNSGNVDPVIVEHHRAIFRDMKIQGAPDVLLNFAQGWHNVVRAMLLEDFAPKVLLGWQGGVTTSWAVDATGLLGQEHGWWAVGFGQWHKSIRYADPVFGTSHEAVQLYESEFQRDLDYNTAGGVATAVVMYVAMKQYADTSWVNLSLMEKRDAIRAAVGDVNDDTMWGPVRFNRYNQNSGRGAAAWQVIPDPSLPQHTASSRRLSVVTVVQKCILPTEAAETSLQQPFPSWSARFSGCGPGRYNVGSACEECPVGTFKSASTPGMFVSEVPDGEYDIQSASAPDLFLSSARDSGIGNSTEEESGETRWRIVSLDGPSFHIIASGGKFLSASDGSGAVSLLGVELASRWLIAPASATGAYTIRENGTSNYLHITDGAVSVQSGAVSSDAHWHLRIRSLSSLEPCGPCPRGKEAAATGASECSDCQRGHHKVFDDASLCTPCSAGRTAPDTGTAECNQCEQGTFSDVVGLANATCALCPPGRFMRDIGGTSCTLCPAGRFTDAIGRQTPCTRCEVGSFQDAEGQTACRTCPSEKLHTVAEGSDSLGECTCRPDQRRGSDGSCQNCPSTFVPVVRAEGVSCECPPGHRFDLSEGGRCIACTERHLDCPGGHRSGLRDETVTVKEGFMTAEVDGDIYSVYTCTTRDACRGDRYVNGARGSMCSNGFDSSVPRCARCAAGTSVQERCASDGSCEIICQACDTNVLMLLLKISGVWATSMFGTLLLYRSARTEDGPGNSVFVLLVEFVQIVQAQLRFDVTWPALILDVKRGLSHIDLERLAFDAPQFQLECFYGDSYMNRVAMQTFAPLIIFFNIAVLWLAFRVVGRSFKADHAYKMLGSVFTKLFLTVISLSLSLFFTEKMPNGKEMVIAFSEVEYLGPNWWKLVPINIASALLFCVPTLSIVAWVVRVAPRLAATSGSFLARFDFVLGGVRPDRWWWSLAQLTFQVTFVSMQLVFASVHVQIYNSLWCVFCFTMIRYAVLPELYSSANNLAVVFKMAQIIFLMIITSFIEIPEEMLKSVNSTFAYVFVIVGATALCFAFYSAVMVFVHKLMPVNANEVTNACNIWKLHDVLLCMLMVPPKELASKSLSMCESDHEHVRAATRAMVNLIFNEQIDTKWTKQRVIPAKETGGEYKIWDHCGRVKELFDHQRDRKVHEAVDRNFALRADMLRITSAFLEHHEALFGRDPGGARSLHKVMTEIFARSAVVRAQKLEDGHLSVSDSFRQRVGLNPQSHMVTIEAFRSLCVEELPDLNLDEKTIDTIFECVDSDGSGTATLQEFANLFYALAPPELLPQRSSGVIRQPWDWSL